jgi:hypothetical protein
MLLLSELTLHYLNLLYSFECRSESLGSIPSERAKAGKWANSMAAKSQLKPSVPSNTHNSMYSYISRKQLTLFSANPGWLEWLDDNNGDISEDLQWLKKLSACFDIFHYL